MQALFNCLAGVAVLLCAWQIRKLWQKIDCLDLKDPYTNERIYRNRKDFDAFLTVNQADRKILLEDLGEVKRDLDEIKDSAMERNLQEAKMFEGILNMMNYDLAQAIKAVKDNG